MPSTRVVGFTTPYIAGYTLKENDTRIFKLKYLEQQATKVVDHPNLQLVIVHGDICPWNLLIDPSTDSIQLFDFNSGAKLGREGDEENNLEFQYDADRDDVKFVIVTVYELITREFNFRQEFYARRARRIQDHGTGRLGTAPGLEARQPRRRVPPPPCRVGQKASRQQHRPLHQGIAPARVATALRGTTHS
ncbi:hypothetical protein BT67DRAFT_442647 [Trichocladium antarcticum]|uniref:Aminoglycoside phosphotransferase domain-containing protein n=1 Tax=Trichocladium antarcticum TaxID=1450529 RepID=A0AAN6ZDD8_9PEZI|nr:hypothetical protein BT67DRAFT_442647 [Trichocladium antarcticum]